MPNGIATTMEASWPEYLMRSPMKKYLFSFAMRTGEKVLEYETDFEPPGVGDIVRFGGQTNGKDEKSYKIIEIWFMPRSQTRVDFAFELEIVP